MAKHSISAICSKTSKCCGGRLTSRLSAAFILAALLISGCGPQRRTVGLDVDLFLNPGSSDLNDVLLQTGISKRLEDDKETKNGIIHVRVVNGMVILSGAVSSGAIKAKAETIAKETVVKLNDATLQSQGAINNRIEVQK